MKITADIVKQTQSIVCPGYWVVVSIGGLGVVDRIPCRTEEKAKTVKTYFEKSDNFNSCRQ